MHVRGTPASGKSILAQLLESFLIKNGTPTLLIHTWCPDKSESAEIYLSILCNRLDLKISPREIQKSNITFIIDEAQVTYPDANNPFKDLGLWNNLIEPQFGVTAHGSTDEDYSIGTPPVGSGDRDQTNQRIPVSRTRLHSPRNSSQTTNLAAPVSQRTGFWPVPR